MTVAKDTFTTEGFAEQVKQLQGIMTTDKEFRRRVQNVIRQVLKEARKSTSESISGKLPDDPRQAYKAVRSSVYRRILGGQINILQKRKAGSPTKYQKPRKGLPKIGGNRWGRSLRTQQLEGYAGPDRGFVLRFLNAGTGDRMIMSYTDKDGNRNSLRSGSTANIKHRGIGGNRGSISARGFFASSSHTAMQRAAESMQELIDRIIAQEFV